MNALADRTWIWFAALFYVAGLGFGTYSLLRTRAERKLPVYGLILAGFILQTIGLYLRGLAVKGCPIGNSFELFQFTGWSATALYLVVGAAFRLSLLGFFTCCLGAVMTTVSLAIPAWDATRRMAAFSNPWIEFHAAIALVAYGVFGLLTLTSVMYLLQHYSLRQRRITGFFSFLPPIVTLDQIGTRLLWVGNALMLVSLAVGTVHWVQNHTNLSVLKVGTTVAVALAYLSVLGLRLGARLVATRLAWTCILLFLAALLSLSAVDAGRKNQPIPAASFEHS